MARISDVRRLANDEVDLRSKVEREILVAHKLVHLDALDDPKLRHALPKHPHQPPSHNHR